MKLVTIGDTLNIRNSVEFLTNAVMAGEAWIVLDTEMGTIPVEIVDRKVHEVDDPNFGISVCQFNLAPETTFTNDLIRSNGRDGYRWYVSIPCVETQSRDFTRELVIRAMMMVLLQEVAADSKHGYDKISPQTVDSACFIYHTRFLQDDEYNYMTFNRELCKLSISPVHRVGQSYRSFLLANRELLRIRGSVARSSFYKCESEFTLHHDKSGEMLFGHLFYKHIFALVVEGLHLSFHNNTPLDSYKCVTGKNIGKGEDVVPVALMKICLLDRSYDKKGGSKE